MKNEQKKIFRQACRAAIAEVYETTLRLNATFDKDQEQHQSVQGKNVIATIGFAGSIEGSLVMIVSDRMACSLVSGMLDTEIKVVDSEVLDGIGEILNIIAGGTRRKGILVTSDFDVSIPSVILAEKKISVAMLKHTETMTIAVDSEKGPALFLLTLADNPQGPRPPRDQRKDKEVAKSPQNLVKNKEV